MTNIRIAHVVGGAGGNGLFVDAITSATISDTRIGTYTFAVTAVSELVLADQNGQKIKHPVLVANTADSIYLNDIGVKCSGKVSLSGASNAGKFYIYYG